MRVRERHEELCVRGSSSLLAWLTVVIGTCIEMSHRPAVQVKLCILLCCGVGFEVGGSGNLQHALGRVVGVKGLALFAGSPSKVTMVMMTLLAFLIEMHVNWVPGSFYWFLAVECINYVEKYFRWAIWKSLILIGCRWHHFIGTNYVQIYCSQLTSMMRTRETQKIDQLLNSQFLMPSVIWVSTQVFAAVGPLHADCPQSWQRRWETCTGFWHAGQTNHVWLFGISLERHQYTQDGCSSLSRCCQSQNQRLMHCMLHACVNIATLVASSIPPSHDTTSAVPLQKICNWFYQEQFSRICNQSFCHD